MEEEKDTVYQAILNNLLGYYILDTGKKDETAYFISSHPGCTEADMAELAVITKSLHFQLEQVQDLSLIHISGMLSAYMIRERSGRYWIVPTCGRTPASSMSVAARGYWKVTCCRTNPAKS